MSTLIDRIPVLYCGRSQFIAERLSDVLNSDHEYYVLPAITDSTPISFSLPLVPEVMVILELRSGPCPPREFRQSLKCRVPQARFVGLLSSCDELQLLDGVEEQLWGICTLDDTTADILNVLEGVVHEEHVLSPSLQPHLIWCDHRQKFQLRNCRPVCNLTTRQVEILQHIASGDSTKEVARKMNVSIKTVDSHKYRIMQKLGLHDRVQLTRLAIREGLVAP